ncbi:MAG: NfeD family protein [Clostridium sp.]|uniref:NfeD family protein n=1 Tax=Clostridium sp. TaxID=1506 RepID=UPI0025C00735|nr:NfeD family protein [Clostridium sp.]MCE5220337.1 NfeD family protein [Clostridium sp.]
MGSAVFWLIIAICAVAIDILTSNFCFMLFSIGAIVAAICGALGVLVVIQIIIFAIINIISLSIGYPWLKKKYKNMNKNTPLMEETYIGKVMESEKEIISKAQVKVNGEYWTVINEGDVIHAGEQFTITGIQGTKLKIKKA